MLAPLEDISAEYQTSVPECIIEMEKNWQGDKADFFSFKEAYLKVKKNLELEIIHNNSRQEVINQIAGLVHNDRTQNRLKYLKVQRRAKHFLALQKYNEMFKDLQRKDGFRLGFLNKRPSVSQRFESIFLN